MSNCTLYAGDLDVEVGEELKEPAVEYLLAADWGILRVRASGGRIRWVPSFSGPPDWEVVERWLRSVERVLTDRQGLDVTGFASKALFNLQRIAS